MKAFMDECCAPEVRTDAMMLAEPKLPTTTLPTTITITHNNTYHHHEQYQHHPEHAYPQQVVPHKILGRRKQRLKALRAAAFDNSLPSENVHVKCLGFSDDPFSVLRLERLDNITMSENRHNHDDDHEAVIAIEATGIGPLDIAIRRGDGSDTLPVPFVLGTNFVGVVQNTGSNAKRDFGIEKGTRVTSMITGGGNARFIKLPVKQLMVVPKRLDAADVACIVSLYLPAFQALHYGTPRPWRFSPTCLKDKRIFITGASLLEVQALTWLARHAGAAQVFVSTCPENFDRIKSYHAIPVVDDPVILLNTLDGLIMDVMIDYDFPRYLHVAQAILDDEKGRLVCCSASPTIQQPAEENQLCCMSSNMIVECWPAMDYFWEQSTLCLVPGASMFNFFESWQNNPAETQMDLTFLLGLLQSRHLRPPIDRFISLSGVPKAHHDLQKGNVQGSIVCEPWKD